MRQLYEQDINAIFGNAQAAYAQNQLTDAASLYGEAYDLSILSDIPNGITAVRTARGAYEATHRAGIEGVTIYGWKEAADKALEVAVEESSLLYGWLEGNLPVMESVPEGAVPVVREIAQSATSAGSAFLNTVARHEHTTGERLVKLQNRAADQLWKADHLLSRVETDDEADQYRANWRVPMAFLQRLYGSRKRARSIAQDAMRHAESPESRDLLQKDNPGISSKNLDILTAKQLERAQAASGLTALPRQKVLARVIKTV